MKRTLRAIATAAAITASSSLLVACGDTASSASSSTRPATVWLCHPGTGSDPCAASLDATVITANGTRSVVSPATPTGARFDCFYVYPTVSTQTTDNSNLVVETAETNVARAQAAPFRQVCRVWAPMYRQRTVTSLLKGLGNDPTGDNVAYRSLLSG
ncbi:MAG TPA: DUF3089 domain-containing protein, partial [Acidimicrobiales bacterium]|nr:DUF3089 domain-containing protein [Acidimicrobiales bacterium]